MSGLLKSGAYLALLVVASILAAGVLSNSLLNLVSTPVNIDVKVENIDTHNAVSGATVNCYVNGLLADSGVTNYLGVVSLWGFFETPVRLEAIADGYATGEINTIFYASGSQTRIIQLIPINTVTDYIHVYCVSNEGYRVTNVLITSSKGSILTDSNGYAKVFIKDGTNTIIFSDYDAKIKVETVWQNIDFDDYQKTFTPISKETYVAYVEQYGLSIGQPPDIPFNYWDILMGSTFGVPNWILIVGALIILWRR